MSVMKIVMKSLKNNLIKSLTSNLFITLIRLLCLLGLSAALPVMAQSTMFTVTDLAGRNVQVPNDVNRIILGESRYIPALAILDKEQPLKRIVGMLADFKQTDPGSYQQYRKKFPQIDSIPQVGHASADSFSIERVLTLNADVAIFGLEGHGPTSKNAELIQQLEHAGIAVIFVDFRQQPLVNTIKSMSLLGRVLGREEQATAFIEFYSKQLARVETVLAVIEDDKHLKSPNVFLHSRVGLQDLCCETMVRGMMATFVDSSRGNNLAKGIVPGAAGVMNLEYLLTMQPDIYIGTAIGSSQGIEERALSNNVDHPYYIVLGAGVDDSMAKASFQAAINDSGVKALTAVKTKNAHAIWHHFYNSPLNIVAVQVFAKWLYPEQFNDLEPQQTMQELFDRFQSVPLDGTYWVSL